MTNASRRLRVAFLGLGRMGSPMARRVLHAGHDLKVWNRSPGKADALAADGATVAGTPAEAAADRDVVVLMLRSPGLPAPPAGWSAVPWSSRTRRCSARSAGVGS